MKLIRLQTTDPQCIFDNTFNAELLVKKGSKIALKDVSINKSLSTVTITGAPENVVSLVIGNDTYEANALAEKKYTTQDFLGLLQDLELKLNQALSFDVQRTNNQNVRGIGLKVDVVDDKIVISTRQSNQNFFLFARPAIGPATFMEANTYKTNITFGQTQADSSVIANSAASNGFNYAICDVPFHRASGWYHAIINDIGGEGGIFGLVDNSEYEARPNALLTEKYKYALKFKGNNDTPYEIYKDGVQQTPLTSPKANVTDHIAMYVSEGNIKISIFTATTDLGVFKESLLFTEAYNYQQTKLIPAVTLLDNSTKLVQVYLTADIQSMPSIQTYFGSGSKPVRDLTMELDDSMTSQAVEELRVFGGAKYPYLSVATTGTTTQSDGHIDASDPISKAGGSVESTEGFELYYDFSALGMGRLAGTHAALSAQIGLNHRSYRHREISHTISGQVPGHIYQLDIILEDLDEHSSAVAVPAAQGGGTVSVYTHPTNNTYVREDAKVYINDALVGTIEAEEGKGETQTVRKVFNGVKADSNGDIKIEISLGFVYNVPTSGANSGVPQVDHDIQQGVRLSSIKLHPNNGLDAAANELPGGNINKNQTITISLHSSVRDFLGYANNPSATSKQPMSMKAVQVFDPSDLAEAFVVEMLSMELNSYDATSNERRSILATIPKSEDVNGNVVYDANYPLFIDINNAEDQLIRVIRARILNPDLSPLKIQGDAYMTILID